MATIIGSSPKRYVRFGIHNLRLNLRIWRRSRPFWAGVIALVGGLPMWYFPAKAVQFLFVSRTPIWAGILVGILVEFFALMLWVQPQFRTMYGMFIVLLSLLSFITSDFGGLFIGMLLGILGGSLALAWTPVVGKTKRQRKWLARSGVIVEPEHETIVLDEPAPVVIAEAIEGPIALEPVALTEAEAATVPPAVMIVEEEPVTIDLVEVEAAEEIDVTGWELPPEQPVPGASEAIDITDEVPAQTIDLREQKATTAPASEDEQRDAPEA